MSLKKNLKITKPYLKRKFLKGQASVEYMMIAAAVLLAIVMGGTSFLNTVTTAARNLYMAAHARIMN
jgi:uncharacterized protein (UPF0333 family)